MILKEVSSFFSSLSGSQGDFTAGNLSLGSLSSLESVHENMHLILFSVSAHVKAATSQPLGPWPPQVSSSGCPRGPDILSLTHLPPGSQGAWLDAMGVPLLLGGALVVPRPDARPLPNWFLSPQLWTGRNMYWKSVRDGTAAVATSPWTPWSWCLSSGVQGMGALKPRPGSRAVEGHTCEGGSRVVAPQ